MASEIKEVTERTLVDVNADYQSLCAAAGHANYLKSLAEKVKQNADNDIDKLHSEICKITDKLDALNAEARQLAAKAAEKAKAVEAAVEDKVAAVVSEVKKAL